MEPFITTVLTYVQSSVEVPVYKLVFLQILAALSNVSGYVEEVHHGQAGWVLLNKEIKHIVNWRVQKNRDMRNSTPRVCAGRTPLLLSVTVMSFLIALRSPIFTLSLLSVFCCWLMISDSRLKAQQDDHFSSLFDIFVNETFPQTAFESLV